MTAGGSSGAGVGMTAGRASAGAIAPLGSAVAPKTTLSMMSEAVVLARSMNRTVTLLANSGAWIARVPTTW